MSKLMEYVDIVVANEEDAEKVFELRLPIPMSQPVNWIWQDTSTLQKN